MGTRMTARHKREAMYNYVKNTKDKSRSRKEIIGWAMIELGCTKNYARDLLNAFIDAGHFTLVKNDGEEFII